MPTPIGKYAKPEDINAVNNVIEMGNLAADFAHKVQKSMQDQADEDLARARQLIADMQAQWAKHDQELEKLRTGWWNGVQAHGAELDQHRMDFQNSLNGAASGVAREDRTQGSGTGQQDVGGLVPAQYNDQELSAAEANAACGPAAAVAFARAYGRNPTLAEATHMAAQVGWNTEGGMNGVANEKVLMDRLGIPTHLEGQADWSKIGKDVSGGNPVVISTPQHYFVVDGYDPSRGFHVGNSGTAVAVFGGHDWMTERQIESAGRGVNGVLYMDHPLGPDDSVAKNMSGGG